MATAARTRVPTLSLVLLLATAVFLNYVDRGSIAVAAPLMKGELGLSATTFGIAVSAFFWVYAPIQLIIGWLCDRVSVYRLFAGGLALWAASTILTGFVGGFTSLLVLRVLLGIGESIAFPGSSKIIARHVPCSYRGLANAAVAVGLAVGPAVGTLGGGLILLAFGWRTIFFVFGSLTLLWLLPWELVIRSVQSNGCPREEKFRVLSLASHWGVWAAGIGHFAANYGLYFILSWLPLYLVQSRGLSIGRMTLLATSVYVSQALSALVLGWISDEWVKHGGSEARIRRAMISVSHAVLATSILGIALSRSEGMLTIWLVLVGACLAVNAVSLFCIAQMLAGARGAGTWVGIQNAIGNIAGIVGPVVTGITIDRTGSYLAGFCLAAAICAAGAMWWALVVPRFQQVELD